MTTSDKTEYRYQVVERESGLKVGPEWKTHNEALRYCLAELESDRNTGYYDPNYYRIITVEVKE